MTSLTSASFASINCPQTKVAYGSSLKPVDQSFLSTNAKHSSYRPLTVRAGGDGKRRGGGTSLFIGGFLLGGLTVGALGCVYASQISQALAGIDREELMKKLPKFIYDEEKVLEKNRKMLEAKIAHLNNVMDNFSAQLHSKDSKS